MTLTWFFKNIANVEYAAPDTFLHIVQWQLTVFTGSLVQFIVIEPHKHFPKIFISMFLCVQRKQAWYTLTLKTTYNNVNGVLDGGRNGALTLYTFE